ncbi:MAG: polyphosphate kinase 1 [Eubacteriales bacterium]
MSKDTQERFCYTQNRELSWLRFDKRVLEEAADPSVPALERLKFVSIFSSNLDEFFMVRVGSLFDLARMTPDDTDNKSGWTASEQLRHIYRAVPGLLAMKKQIYSSVMDELSHSGIQDVSPDTLDTGEMKFISRFFKSEMLPILSPILIGSNHPIPHLVNKHLYAAALLESKKDRKAVGIVPLPESLPLFLLLPDGKRYVRTENILLHWLPTLFGACSVKESCILCVTRNADISFDDEKFDDNEEDFRRQMKKLLKKRDHLAVVRLELGIPVSSEFQEKLSSLVRVEKEQVCVDVCPLNMRYVFRLAGELSKDVSARLLYPVYHGRWPEDLCQEQPITAQVQQKDRLLFYPYDSVDPFLRLLNEAAEDPRVLSIKITIYRLASSSKIAQTLCRAAENGKEVLVLMELRARFDEENNLAWSKMLEESGCQVIYGTEGFKCHSKICLITLRSRNKTGYLTQIGTGNYNEKTTAMYTDLSFMTADTSVGEDAAKFFRNMLVNKLDGEYSKLCVSPLGIKTMLLEQIDRQIALGKEGYLCIKTNSVTEREVIDKLVEASQAGVEVQLIIRGICCILPGIPGYTENIHVTSVVGRFLEHARVYIFGRGADADAYISSADLMTRNLNRRVEIACPVQDAQLRDTAKASTMLPDGSYCRRNGAVPFDSQAYFMEQSPHIPEVASKKPQRITDLVKNLLERILR